MSQTIYLAGPIHNTNYEKTHNWRNVCKEQLEDHFNILCPTVRIVNGDHSMITYDYKKIITQDKKDIISSDIILANCWKVSVGTSMEVLFAYERNRKIIAVVPDLNSVSLWILGHSNNVFDNIQGAINHLIGEYT